jgi:hypothetical protein
MFGVFGVFGGKDLANETPKNLSIYAASASSQRERSVVCPYII